MIKIRLDTKPSPQWWRQVPFVMLVVMSLLAWWRDVIGLVIVSAILTVLAMIGGWIMRMIWKVDK